MGKYKVEISGIKTNELECINSEEMKKLFMKYHNDKDLFARDILINSNLKLVLSVLKKFYNKSDNLDDLFQIGCVGLIKAIDNFDLSYNVKFSTYAVPMILGEIRRYIRDNNSMRISRSLKDIAYKVLKFKDEYYSVYGKDPSTSIIASSLGFSEFDISNALIALKDPISMYEPIYSDGGDTIYLYDQIEDKTKNNSFSEKVILENALENLDIREKHILDERYIMGKSQMEIAEELSISQAQVSRLEKKAINQLKKTLK